jgi:two-component system response regulator FixJ
MGTGTGPQDLSPPHPTQPDILLNMNSQEPVLVEVVDDDQDIRRMLVLVLEAHGFQVRAHNGGAAYLAAERSVGRRVMLLDVRMPGMSGIAVHAQLKARGDNIPVIFMSGESLPHETIAAQNSDAIAFLWKPFRTQLMLEALDKAIGTPPK